MTCAFYHAIIHKTHFLKCFDYYYFTLKTKNVLWLRLNMHFALFIVLDATGMLIYFYCLQIWYRSCYHRRYITWFFWMENLGICLRCLWCNTNVSICIIYIYQNITSVSVFTMYHNFCQQNFFVLFIQWVPFLWVANEDIVYDVPFLHC